MQRYLEWWFSDNPGGSKKASWRRVGVKGASDLAGWRSLGIQKPGDVQRWLSVAHDRREVRRWLHRNCQPEDASAWRTVAESFREVDSWIGMGIGPQEAAVWRAAVDSADQVVRAKRLGLEAERAKWLSDNGGDVRAWADWLWAGVETVEEAVAWGAAGESYRSARAWLRRGFAREDAVEWRDEGKGPLSAAWERRRGRGPEHRAWLEAGAETIEKARRWQHVGSIDEMKAWLRAGVSDPEEVRELRRAGVDSDLYVRWCSLGLSSAVEVVEHAQFWPGAIDQVTNWVNAGCVDAVEAMSWRRVVVEPDDQAAWKRVGFDAPGHVNAWIELGFDPAGASSWNSAGFNPREAAAWVAADDSVESAVAWRAAGVTGAAGAMRLRSGGLDLSQLTQWQALGVIPIDAVLAHAACWRDAADAAVWVEAGAGNADEAKAWRELLDSPDELSAWVTTGFDSVDAAAPWVTAGFAPYDAARWRDVGHGFDDPREAQRWREVGFAAAPAARWAATGMTDPVEARDLEGEGLTAEGVRGWLELGADSIVSVRTWEATWDLAAAVAWSDATPLTEAYEWWQRLGGDLGMRTELLVHGITDLVALSKIRDAVPGALDDADVARICCRLAAVGISVPEGAVAWLRVGDVGHAVDWASAGVAEPTKAAAWTSHGFTAEAAAPWLAAGFVSPVQAERWEAASIPPDEAAEWRTVVSGPQEVERWRAVGATSPGTVRRWIDLDVREPARVRELGRVGLALDDYESLMEGADPSRRAERLRFYCFERAGLTLEDDVPTWTLVDVEPHTIAERAVRMAEAAHRAGENWFRIRHTWERWEPAFVDVLPDARWVRGHEAVELHRLRSTGLLTATETPIEVLHDEEPASILLGLIENPDGDGLFALEEPPR